MTNIWSLASILLSLASVQLTPTALFYHPAWNHDAAGDSVRMVSEIRERGPEKIANNSLGVAVTAQAAIVVDKRSQQVLWEKNADDVRAIGSISKLVSAMVIVQQQPDWQSWVEIQPGDIAPEGKQNFTVGTKIKFSDLFNAALVASDNHAIRALARSTGLTPEEFAQAMNRFAQSEGLTKSHFVEPTGLSAENVSTAREIARIAARAFAEDRIRKAVGNASIDVTDQAGVAHHLVSTNKLFKSFVNISAAKTGFIEAAGYCLAAEADQNSHPLIVVNLGSASDADRFQDMKMLAYWAWQNYTW